MKYTIRYYSMEGLIYLSYANNGKLTTFRNARKIALFNDEWEAHLQARNYLQQIGKTYFYEIGTMTNEEEETTEIMAFISRYSILINGKVTERKIKGWRNALTHAQRYTADLFENNIIEILNVWTGEIISLEEAEKRAKKYGAKLIKTAIQ